MRYFPERFGRIEGTRALQLNVVSHTLFWIVHNKAPTCPITAGGRFLGKGDVGRRLGQDMPPPLPPIGIELPPDEISPYRSMANSI